jgi:PPOX class probable F420-dependent enzyme
VCYVFDGRSCFSAIDAKPKRTPAGGLRRIRNISENPRVSLVVDRYDEEWTRLAWVIVQGHADVLTDGPERAGAVDLLRDKYAQYRALGLDRATATVIRISPERAMSWRWSGSEGAG